MPTRFKTKLDDARLQDIHARKIGPKISKMKSPLLPKFENSKQTSKNALQIPTVGLPVTFLAADSLLEHSGDRVRNTSSREGPHTLYL
jgi:hypothetical protein